MFHRRAKPKAPPIDQAESKMFVPMPLIEDSRNSEKDDNSDCEAKETGSSESRQAKLVLEAKTAPNLKSILVLAKLKT